MIATRNWITVAESKYPRETDAFNFVRQTFPTHEPYRAWTNFEFIADDGSINSDYLLEEIIAEGPGYQDWLATHVRLQDIQRRVRLYHVRTESSQEDRGKLERAALREFQLVETLQHPAVLPPRKHALSRSKRRLDSNPSPCYPRNT
jgi:hypothetical protein